MMKIRLIISYFLITILILGLGGQAYAKCAVFTVVIDGELPSSGEKQTILVRVHANRGEKIFQTELTPENHRFRATIPFDSFVSAHMFGGHNCSRVPTRIDVVLLDSGVAKKTMTLSIEHDFDWDSKLSEWHVKAPVVF